VILSLVFILIAELEGYTQNTITVINKKEVVYLIPGQGSDGRVFKNLKLDPYDTIILQYIVPYKNELLPEYAKRMASQIDTLNPFSIIGMSFGGMIAVEISKFTHPKKIILISSAKTCDEYPFRYKLLSFLPLYKLFGGKILKEMAHIAQPIFEPICKQDKKLFISMINNKDSRFMVRSIDCIAKRKNHSYRSDIIHIHGNNDHTIFFRNINNPICIEGGSHFMVYFNAEEISKIILTELNK
jgi:hypothetical protein